MHEAVKLLNDDLERKHGVRTHMRIGINTGEVIAGLLAGDVHGAYTVVGDTVNTAQRFESAAPHDGILVSEPTWRLTRRAFDFELTPPLALKGKADPQKAYRVLGRRYSDLESAATPLIGRTSELGKLKDQLALAADGSGCLLHVTGEAGVGKSRLLREFRATVAPEVLQIVARCASVEIDTPYALIARLLRALLQIAPGTDEAIARPHVEQLLSTVDDVPDPMNVDLFLDVLGYAERSTLDPQSKQRVLLGLVRRLFDRHTSTQPLMVIAEDLHWS